MPFFFCAVLVALTSTAVVVSAPRAKIEPVEYIRVCSDFDEELYSEQIFGPCLSIK